MNKLKTINTTETLSEPHPRMIREELPADHVVVGTEIYDEMEDLTDPAPTVVQVIPAENYWTVVQDESGEHRLTPVSDFEVYSDGSLLAVDEEGEDLTELAGFAGFIFKEGSGDVSSSAVEKLLAQTRVHEEEEE